MTSIGFHILSVLIFLPLADILLIAAVSREKPDVIKGITFLTALANFLISLLLYRAFDSTTHELQFTTTVPWIEEYGISYHLGIDAEHRSRNREKRASCLSPRRVVGGRRVEASADSGEKRRGMPRHPGGVVLVTFAKQKSPRVRGGATRN